MKLRMILVMAATVGVLASVPKRAAHADEHHGWGDYASAHFPASRILPGNRPQQAGVSLNVGSRAS